jgi:glutamine amidotransferase PdxT
MRKKAVKIGVLDIQGSVIEHVAALEKVGAEVVRVKNIADLASVAG